MTLNEAKKLAEKYRKEIEYHNRKYYEEDSPEIDDYEYDMILRNLENLEKEFPELSKDAFSPTHKVGGRASEKFSAVKHKVKMESLHDSFSKEEIQAFDKRVRNVLEDISYVVEPKVDGLSVSVEYENGVLTRASTRGDGLVGEDITENILTISSLPKVLKEKIPLLEVRGEVYISKEDFAKLVKLQEEQGSKPFKNPRNAAAGSLRQKDAKITASRNLNICVFNIQQIIGRSITSHKESLDFLKQLGFPVIPMYKLCTDIESVIAEIDNLEKIKNSLPFQIDGAVIKLDQIEKRSILGSTSKFPRWAEAYKYHPEEKETTLLDIEINVGRTGILTPLGILEPVLISGTVVRRVSLHNEDFIKEKNIKIGDTLLIRKAGEIIPEVIKVVKDGENAVEFSFPKICPSCGSEVFRENEEVAIRCINSRCPQQLVRNIIHFVSRNAMDIEGVGETLVAKLVENGIINSAVDLYSLNSNDLTSLERMGEKSSDNILKAISASKSRSLDRFLFALGIRHVGEKAAKLIAQKFENIDNIINAQPEEILAISGIGSTIAESITEYFSVPSNKDLINKFKECGLEMPFEKIIKNDFFADKVFVLTGSLENYTRKEATDIIQKFGGNVTSSVSKNVDFVIAGINAGSKLTKAQKLNLPIIDEFQFAKWTQEL